MYKTCEPCRTHVADFAATACPICHGPLRTTLLGPPGQTPSPLTGVAGADGQLGTEPREGWLDGFGVDPLVLKVAAVVLLAVGGFAVRHFATAGRMSQLRPGMPIAEAARLIDTGKGWHHPDRVRFRDRFGPDDTSDGTFTMSGGGGGEVSIAWRNGIVTSVDKGSDDSTPRGGMRRAVHTQTSE